MKRYKLLDKWIYQAISDNPDMVKSAHSSIDIYQALQHIFIQDMQLSLRDIAKEVLKSEKN
jgi:hypothetical protein